MEYTIAEQDKIGKDIAEILQMHKNRAGKYKTCWGDKTNVGIFNMIKILGEAIENKTKINK